MSSQEPLHTEQIQDIIGTPPRWLHRWGITIILSVALMCILISAKINYPEAVNAKLKIVSTHLPENVFPKDSTRLVKILVANDTQVKKGDNLAVTKNATGETIIRSPIDGKLTYAHIIHENEQLAAGHNIFFITVANGGFYGEATIAQHEAHRIKPGQTVLIKLSNSGEKQTDLRGSIKYVIRNQFENGECLAEVDFDTPKVVGEDNYFLLKNGMIANAEIITAKSTLLQRFIKSLTGGIK